MDFSHLQKLDVKGKTAEYIVYQIEDEPVLVLKPAVESNKLYFNAVLAQNRNKLKAQVNQKMIKEQRAEDRDLFSKFVVTDWRNVNDSKKKPVAFTQENCAEFLEALPDWIFDEIRLFATTSSNFAYEKIDVAGKVKN